MLANVTCFAGVTSNDTTSAWLNRPQCQVRSWPTGFGQQILILFPLLLAFGTIQFFLPLRTAIKIGADEDYELSKVMLSLKGYKFYTEIWNDQPLLHTFIVTETVRHISPSVFAARLVTSVFAAILLASVFVMALRVSGLLVASLTTALVIAAPGFVELSGSCMVEIPALAPALAGLAVLMIAPQSKWHLREVISGLFFAAAFQIKFINIILLPLVALVLWLSRPKGESFVKSLMILLAVFAASLAVAFVIIGILIGEGSYWMQLKQSWTAHFASTKSFEYGSPADYPFQWSTFLKNWDTTLPAIVGIFVCLHQRRASPFLAIPLVWFALVLIVFGTHKPWWSYYYVHNAIPLCWCAAIGIAWILQRVQWRRNRAAFVLCVLFALGASAWAVSRVYFQVTSIRNSPKIYSSLVLKEIERYKPFTRFIYTDEPVYSFHSGIPLPPQLAVVSLKRFWSGDMTNARLTEELRSTRPGLILLGNDTRELPFSDWLAQEYRLVYQDGKHRLYAHVTIADKAEY